MEYRQAPVFKLRSFCGIVKPIAKNLMAWGVPKNTCRIDALGVPKATPLWNNGAYRYKLDGLGSTEKYKQNWCLGSPKIHPGAPKIDPAAPKIEARATENEWKSEKIGKVCLQGYLGRASVAPGIDFGCHLGALRVPSWPFWEVFWCLRAILDVAFLCSQRGLFFITFFKDFLTIPGMIYVVVFHVFLLQAVAIFRIRFCTGLVSFYEVPSRSENLRRSAFYTVKTKVFPLSAFSDDVFVFNLFFKCGYRFCNDFVCCFPLETQNLGCLFCNSVGEAFRG